MSKKYEYKFVKVGSSFWTTMPKEDLQTIIGEHGKDGWRLVQILYPMSNVSRKYEVIFEREISG